MNNKYIIIVNDVDEENDIEYISDVTIVKNAMFGTIEQAKEKLKEILDDYQNNQEEYEYEYIEILNDTHFKVFNRYNSYRDCYIEELTEDETEQKQKEVKNGISNTAINA